MTDEMLAKMWQSNEDFHNRFLGRPATLDEALVAYREECKELEESSLNDAVDWNTACEAADVLYTVTGLLRSEGIDLEMFLDAMQHVTAKNDAKTLDTHYVNDAGKIQRKVRK